MWKQHPSCLSLSIVGDVTVDLLRFILPAFLCSTFDHANHMICFIIREDSSVAQF